MKFRSFLSLYLLLIVGLMVVSHAGLYYVLSQAGSDAVNTGVLAVSGASIIAAVLLALALAADVSRVAKKLTRVIRSAEMGEKTAPVELDRSDEFAELARALNELVDRDKTREQANQDPLTGLTNRRHLMQRLTKLLENGTVVSLMFLDLDGFKPINDKFGHETGDEALKTIAERLRACVRENDILCRLGGDEFVIAFVSLGDKDVLSKRAELVLKLVSEPFWLGDDRLKMGVSIGIATSPADGKDAEALLNAADESMYAAKQGGKNGFRFYS